MSRPYRSPTSPCYFSDLTADLYPSSRAPAEDPTVLLVVSEHIQTQTTLQARHEYWPLPLPAILAIVCAHKQLLLLPSKSLLEVIFSVRRTRPRLPILLSYTVFFFVWLSILVFNRTKTPHGWHPLFCSLAYSQHQHQTPTQKTHLNE